MDSQYAIRFSVFLNAAEWSWNLDFFFETPSLRCRGFEIYEVIILKNEVISVVISRDAGTNGKLESLMLVPIARRI